MARICTVCDKRPQVGNLVSNANNRVKRWIYPNVHTIRFVRNEGGSRSIERGKVCTRCVKAGKVSKIS
ncbi:MAG TPA: 50S ribosomal protein L28 [Candidatus Babeliales bacterium]|jgi:large subunit ribosomal protein L28|nr:50S ribosomal protein L28 [Candidatus Babeliales bacterium]